MNLSRELKGPRLRRRQPPFSIKTFRQICTLSIWPGLEFRKSRLRNRNTQNKDHEIIYHLTQRQHNENSDFDPKVGRATLELVKS